jgi:putative inorganic carbon (hco3(-)) transporter
MSEKAMKSLVIALAVLFILANTFLLTQEFYWLNLLPLVAAIIGAAFFSLDKLLYFLIFFTPISLSLEELDLGVSISVPTEPLFFGILLLFLLKFLQEGIFDRAFLKHPITIVIGLQLLWMCVTSITSEIPLVSFKYFTARLWSIAALYMVMSRLFTTEKKLRRFFWYYMLPLCGVVIYTTVQHAEGNFSKTASIMASYPFIKEHTAYGAILALYAPAAIAFAFVSKENINRKALALGVFVVLFGGLIALVMYLRINKFTFWGLTAVVLLIIAVNLQPLLQSLEKNNQDSSDNLGEHVESISNISTDASNLERINRWKSAMRMFNERPFMGFGPGTYQFTYAPYQKPYEKTIISTNNGDVGNAHSEYIGPMAEQGVFGLLLTLLLVYQMMRTGIRVYYQSASKKARMYALTAMCGLVTYWVHGFLNNFLDNDKTSLAVWGFSALLLMLDLKRVDFDDEPQELPSAANT